MGNTHTYRYIKVPSKPTVTISSITVIDSSRKSSFGTSSGQVSITYTAAQNCYVFCGLTSFSPNSTGSSGTITIDGSAIKLLDHQLPTNSDQLSMKIGLVYLPTGCTVTLKSGGATIAYSARGVMYVACTLG